MKFHLPRFLQMSSTNKAFTQFLNTFKYKEKVRARFTIDATATFNRAEHMDDNDSTEPMDIDDDDDSQTSNSSSPSPLKTEKQQYIYVFKTNIKGVYKVGRTNNLDVRKRTYNTGIIKFDFEYTNEIPDKKLETIIFNFLNKYRVEKNREFFSCDLGKIIHTIEESIKLYNAINGPIKETPQTTTSKSNKRRRTVSPSN